MYLDFNPQTDLEIDRIITAEPSLVWRCWTQVEHLSKWLATEGSTLEEVRMDPRPGGEFYTRIRDASGQPLETRSCILALGQNRFMAFTDGLAPGFRPAKVSSIAYTLILGPDATGTRHILRALHKSPAEKARTLDNRLHHRWGQSIGQLAEYANDLRRQGE